MLERHPSVKLWLDGHDHDGNYGVRAGIHYLNLKGMLDTEETAYGREGAAPPVPENMVPANGLEPLTY